MLPIPPELEELYNGLGYHLGGIYPPLMVNWVLTKDYERAIANRPAVGRIGGLEGAELTLGLVWMMPVPSSPLLPLSQHALGAMVQTVDRGFAVVIHADTEDAINAVCSYVNPWLGGGHA